MFGSILDDIKYQIRQGDKWWAVIIICTAIFLLDTTIGIIYLIAPSTILPSTILKDYFSLPLQFSNAIYKPWSIITYGFLHANFFHLFFNMLMLFWFGQIYTLYMGYRHSYRVLLGGVVFGGIAALLVYTFVPYFSRQTAYLVGASAAVEAVVFAATALNPEHEMRLLLFGRVKLKYIAFATLILNYIGIAGSNAGGVIAHLGGALWGYFYIIQLRSGIDVFASLKNIFIPKPKMVVTHSSQQPIENKDETQLNIILDKISTSGYDSLTKTEKTFLEEYAKK